MIVCLKVLPIFMGFGDYFSSNKKEAPTRMPKKAEAQGNALHPKAWGSNIGSSTSRPPPSEPVKSSMSGMASQRHESKPKDTKSRSLRGGVRQRTPSEHSDCVSMDDGYVNILASSMGPGDEGSTADAGSAKPGLHYGSTHSAENSPVDYPIYGTRQQASETNSRVSPLRDYVGAYHGAVDGHFGVKGSGLEEGALRLASVDLQSGTSREVEAGLDKVRQEEHNDSVQALKMENTELRSEVRRLEEQVESMGATIASLSKPRVVHVGVKEVERAAGGAEEQPGGVEALQRRIKKLRDELEAERRLRNEAEGQCEQLEPLVKQLRQERDEARQQGQGQVSSSAFTDLKVKLEKAEAAKEKAEARACKAMKENDALKSERDLHQQTEAEARGVAKRWVRRLCLPLGSDVEGSPLSVVLTEVLTEVERHSSEGAQAEVAEARRVLRTLGVDDDTRGVAHVLQTAHQRWAVDLSKVQGEKEELLQQVAEARRRAQDLALGSPSRIERSTLADMISIIAQEVKSLAKGLTGSKQELSTVRQEKDEMERQWRREQTRMAQEAMDMEQELRRLRTDKARVEEEKREQERQKEAERREKAEVLRREEQLRAYALGLEQQAREPPRPAYTTPLYVAFNSEPQRQYEPNVQHIARLLNDPPAEIKGVVSEPSELRAAEGAHKVLLYVTYCPNPRLCADRDRLQAFVDVPGVKVVFLILKRGVGSQLTDLKSARELVPCLPPVVLHYTISGDGLEHGHVNSRSSDELGHFLRGVFPPPPVVKPAAPSVPRPTFLPRSASPPAPQRTLPARPVSPELTGPSTGGPIAPYGAARAPRWGLKASDGRSSK